MVNNLIIIGMVICILMGCIAIILEFKDVRRIRNSIDNNVVMKKAKSYNVNNIVINDNLAMLKSKGKSIDEIRDRWRNSLFSRISLKKDKMVKKRKERKENNKKMKPSPKNI